MEKQMSEVNDAYKHLQVLRKNKINFTDVFVYKIYLKDRNVILKTTANSGIFVENKKENGGFLRPKKGQKGQKMTWALFSRSTYIPSCISKVIKIEFIGVE